MITVIYNFYNLESYWDLHLKNLNGLRLETCTSLILKERSLG